MSPDSDGDGHGGVRIECDWTRGCKYRGKFVAENCS